jgi:hypothetical protein
MKRREIYDSIVKEVTDDLTLIKPLPQTYEDTVHNGSGVMLPTDLAMLNAPVSALSDIDVRDGLIVRALQDEKFAFVLVAKVAGAVYDNKDNVTQDDVEALAVVANITAMWEQTNHAELTLKVIEEVIEEANTLVEPSLVYLTKQILKADGFPFKEVRGGTNIQLAEIEERLNTNSEKGE